jgi:hypothetical protein
MQFTQMPAASLDQQQIDLQTAPGKGVDQVKYHAFDPAFAGERGKY